MFFNCNCNFIFFLSLSYCCLPYFRIFLRSSYLFLQLKECLNLNHNLRSNRELRVEIKRRFTKFGDNMFFVFWIGVRLLIYELK